MTFDFAFLQHSRKSHFSLFLYLGPLNPYFGLSKISGDSKKLNFETFSSIFEI